MRRELIETFQFLGYCVFMPMFCIVGIVYKPLLWIVTKCSSSVK